MLAIGIRSAGEVGACRALGMWRRAERRWRCWPRASRRVPLPLARPIVAPRPAVGPADWPAISWSRAHLTERLTSPLLPSMRLAWCSNGTSTSPMSSPVVADDSVFIGSFAGWFYKINAVTGIRQKEGLPRLPARTYVPEVRVRVDGHGRARPVDRQGHGLCGRSRRLSLRTERRDTRPGLAHADRYPLDDGERLLRLVLAHCLARQDLRRHRVQLRHSAGTRRGRRVQPGDWQAHRDVLHGPRWPRRRLGVVDRGRRRLRRRIRDHRQRASGSAALPDHRHHEAQPVAQAARVVRGAPRRGHRRRRLRRVADAVHGRAQRHIDPDGRRVQ